VRTAEVPSRAWFWLREQPLTHSNERNRRHSGHQGKARSGGHHSLERILFAVFLVIKFDRATSATTPHNRIRKFYGSTGVLPQVVGCLAPGRGFNGRGHLVNGRQIGIDGGTIRQHQTTVTQRTNP
jgi:hypothetical protein